MLHFTREMKRGFGTEIGASNDRKNANQETSTNQTDRVTPAQGRFEGVGDCFTQDFGSGRGSGVRVQESAEIKELGGFGYFW